MWKRGRLKNSTTFSRAAIQKAGALITGIVADTVRLSLFGAVIVLLIWIALTAIADTKAPTPIFNKYPQQIWR